MTQCPAIGRFAPSPTGELHLGSLTTAVASYCHIKSLAGRWLLRIEDTDHERCHTQFSRQILKDLENLGLYWDGDVIYQSERIDIYQDHLRQPLKPFAYACQCSRKHLQQYFANHPKLPSHRYPRCCLNAGLDWQQHKIRLQLPDKDVEFVDGIQGKQIANPQQQLGDMVVRRDNGIINYILAVSIDDALQGITHVMRGLDILPMTAAQISIAKMAGLPSIQHWYHLPLIINSQGQKLSKQNLAQPIDSSQPSALLARALKLLKQPKVDMDTPERMLAQAVLQWNNQPLRHQQALN